MVRVFDALNAAGNVAQVLVQQDLLAVGADESQVAPPHEEEHGPVVLHGLRRPAEVRPPHDGAPGRAGPRPHGLQGQRVLLSPAVLRAGGLGHDGVGAVLGAGAARSGGHPGRGGGEVGGAGGERLHGAREGDGRHRAHAEAAEARHRAGRRQPRVVADVLRGAHVTVAVNRVLRPPPVGRDGRDGRQYPAVGVVAHEDGLAGVLHQPPLLLLQVVQAKLLQRVVDEGLRDLPVGDFDLADVEDLEEVRAAGGDVGAQRRQVGGAAQRAAGAAAGARERGRGGGGGGAGAAVSDLLPHLREQLHHILRVLCLVQVAEQQIGLHGVSQEV